MNGNVTSRKGKYYHWPLNVPNSTAQYQTVTVVSQYGAGQTESGKAYVPPATESFVHDADGNLTSDGRWTYTWDGENRLVQMIRDSDTPSGARQKLVFEYDWQGRRIRKQFYTYSGGWVEQTDTICLYHDWNLMGELNANASNAKVRTYVWDTDLSGSMTGAGGVGGLLKVTHYGSTTMNAFVAYDGNGNVSALVDAASGSVCARYDYGPFAEPVRATGPMSDLNPLRFSTKYTDPESGLLYYGYRYYNPSTGRWLSRDPIEEEGGINVYCFVGNDPLRFIDALGLWKSGVWGTQHKDLTVNGLNTALAQQKLSEACKSKIRDILVDADEGQDKGVAANEMFRHFNRKYVKGETPQEVAQRRASARQEYAVYTMGEEISFYYISDCWERLKALGRVSHSWQDYYAHGVHTSGGFVDPIGGSPTSFGEFWPSSYNAWNARESGEHPNRAEPVEVSSRRYQQAEAYTALRFRRMLVEYWLPSCKCLCQ